MVDPRLHSTAGPRTSGRERGRDRSRGAVIVEAVLVLPILMLIVFGAVEYGLVYRDDLRLTTAARSGARIGTADKDSTGAAVNIDDDYQILQAVYATLGNKANQVNYVSIYDAGSDPNGAPSAACSGTNPTSQSTPVGAECDVWPASAFTLSASAVETSPNYVWTSRFLTLNSTQEPSYLGVYIQMRHSYITGLFASSRSITERAVFRFEPVGNTTRGHSLAPLAATTTTATTAPGPTTTSGPTTSTTAPPTSTTTTSTTQFPSSTTSRAPTSTTTSTTRAPTTSTSSSPTTSTTRPPTTSTTAPPATTTTVIVIIPT